MGEQNFASELTVARMAQLEEKNIALHGLMSVRKLVVGRNRSNLAQTGRMCRHFGIVPA